MILVRGGLPDDRDSALGYTVKVFFLCDVFYF